MVILKSSLKQCFPGSPTGSYKRGSCYVQPTRSRLQSLTIVNPRIRSNSVTIYNDDGDDVTSTSYGPVMLEEDLGKEEGHLQQ